MKTATFQQFVSFARTDAAIQERVTEALKSSQPVQNVVSLATDCGYALAPDEVAAALDGALSDQDLDAVVGGVGGYRAPGEWFAESDSTALKKTPKGVD
jgi:hypothetical protein